MAMLLSDKNQRTLREVPDDADLPALCRAEEEVQADGYAVLASSNGRLVADGAGYWDDEEGPSPRSAAVYAQTTRAVGLRETE